MRKFGIFLLILLGFGLIVSLYVIKTRTQTAYQEVRRIEKLIDQERDAITVLNAEIAHLQSPQRLGELAQKYVDLRPTQIEQISNLDALDDIAPLREDLLREDVLLKDVSEVESLAQTAQSSSQNQQVQP